jgi:hypothetical protein
VYVVISGEDSLKLSSLVPIFGDVSCFLPASALYRTLRHLVWCMAAQAIEEYLLLNMEESSVMYKSIVYTR